MKLHLRYLTALTILLMIIVILTCEINMPLNCLETYKVGSGTKSNLDIKGFIKTLATTELNDPDMQLVIRVIVKKIIKTIYIRW